MAETSTANFNSLAVKFFNVFPGGFLEPYFNGVGRGVAENGESVFINNVFIANSDTQDSVP